MKHIKVSLLFTIPLLSVLIFSVQNYGQEGNSLFSTEEAVTESVKLAPCKKEERLEAVKKLFVQMGAKDDEILIEKFNKDKISNIVLKKKGKTDETIVVGAHYDRVDDGCGAIDNWTGIVIMAHLFKSMNSLETNKSYIFVAFDQEEKGLLGSDAMTKAIPKENRKQYCSMVNFDSFGFAAPMSLRNASSSKMISLAEDLAVESKFKFVSVDIAGADSDSTSFKKRDIPAITFSGLAGDWQNYLHSSNDKLEKINMKSVYLGYRFGLAYLAKLDASSCEVNK